MEVVKLPWDLEEEILSRLPPRSLVRFRSVCKHWDALFSDKRFLNNHVVRARPQFMILTESNIYSIDIDLSGTIEVGWIEYEDKGFHFCGLGYDNSIPGKGYKILGYFDCLRRVSYTFHISYRRVATYECSSHAFKFIDAPYKQWPIMSPLSLNGNLYWLAYDPETYEYFIRTFDFSKEIFKPFCLLPCQKNRSRDELVLAVFRGDRFSLLKQCYVTGKIDIWVTDEKIDGVEVVWINLMTLPTTNLPKLVNKYCGISYFIYDMQDPNRVLWRPPNWSGLHLFCEGRYVQEDSNSFRDCSVFSLCLSSKFFLGSCRIQIATSLNFGLFLFYYKSQFDKCVLIFVSEPNSLQGTDNTKVFPSLIWKACLSFLYALFTCGLTLK